MKNIIRIGALALLGLGLASCNGSSGDSTATTVTTPNSTESATVQDVFVPVSAQTRTPGSAYITLAQSTNTGNNTNT